MTTSKPERIGPYPENIPDELKRLPRWVMWQWVWDEKKRRWDKPPLQVNGRNASSTDPATWTTFDAALAACGNGGRFDGIGIALGDDYAGVDFDHCIAPSGEINPHVLKLIEDINSYTERSPSGTGFKMLVRGKLPGKGHHKKFEDIELGVFDNSRYFCVTGDGWPEASAEIEPRQAELNNLVRRYWPQDFEPKTTPAPATITVPVDLSDAVLIDKARSAKNGAKFSKLWDGVWSDYDSHSEGDLALCTLLGFWCCRDAARIDGLFRQSGLMREKWDRDDYRHHTIERAIAQVSEVYEPRPERISLVSSAEATKQSARESPPKGADSTAIVPKGAPECPPAEEASTNPLASRGIKIVDVGNEWLDTEPPATEPVFENFVDLRQRVAVIGGSKRRKSFVVATAAILSAAGKDGIGIKAVMPRKTLLVQFEIEERYMWRRIQKLCRPMGITKEDIVGRLFIVNLRDQLDDEKFEEKALEIIAAAMKETGAEVLFIDPIYVLITGEENETSGMRRLLRKLGTLCRNGQAALIYAHHDKKSGHYDQELSNRGSGTGLTARDYDGAMFLSPHESGDDDLTVVEFLVRHAPPREPYCIRWDWDEDSHYFVKTDDAPKKATKATKTKRDASVYIDKARAIITEYKAQIGKTLPPGSPPPMMPKTGFKEKMRSYVSEREFRAFCAEWVYDEEDGTGGPDSPIRAYKDKTKKNRKFVDNSFTWSHIHGRVS